MSWCLRIHLIFRFLFAFCTLSSLDRRLTRLAFRHTHQSVPCTDRPQVESALLEPHMTDTLSLTSPSPTPICPPSEYLLHPPTLSTPTPLLGKRSPIHGTPDWLAYPPTLSNPKTPVSSNHQLLHLDCKHSNIEPILSTAASLLQLRTPLTRAEAAQLQASPVHPGHSRRRTPSTASAGENLSEASESTASMPNVNNVFRSLDSTKKRASSQTIELLNQGSNPQPRLRSASRTSKTLTGISECTQIIPRPAGSAKAQPDTSVSTKTTKRRRSFDQLAEPSIHGSPNMVVAGKPRERRSVQLFQLEPRPTHVSHPLVDTSYLHVTDDYFLPDFTQVDLSSVSHEKLITRIESESFSTHKRKDDTITALIEGTFTFLTYFSPQFSLRFFLAY